MAKIIYGVAGQGFGHSTRSKEIIRFLVSQGHQVLVFTYGQALFFLDKDFEVVEIPGLGLTYENNKLVYWKTVFKNTKVVFKQSRNWKKITKKFKDFNPDLVFTDFEPITALLAKQYKKHLISIDNQHQLTNSLIEVPDDCRKDFVMDKLIIKSMVWGADYYLATSFFQTKVIKKNTFIFTPILRQEILDLHTNKEKYILVYQTSSFNGLIEVLKKFSNYKFVLFGLNKEAVEDNIEYKNYSSHEWLRYLANCQAIIGNAGLSLISEALHLKKPYLAIPIKKQTEQIINAQYLQRKGYGLFTYKLTPDDFNEFIGNLPKYEKNLEEYNRQDNSAIFEKIKEIINNFS